MAEKKSKISISREDRENMDSEVSGDSELRKEDCGKIGTSCKKDNECCSGTCLEVTYSKKKICGEVYAVY